jgi:hypothetical protein
MKLYHGTDGRNIKRMLRDGIHPRKITRKNNWGHSVSSNPHAVYLTTAYAGYFAMLAAKTSLLGILEIDSSRLDKELFRPDEDFIEQAARKTDEGMKERTKHFRDNIEDYSHLWKKSLEYLGTCSYAGNIPPSAITRASTFDYKKNRYIARELLDPTITIANFRFCADKYQALTSWLIGDDIEPDRLLLVPRSMFGEIPKDVRTTLEEDAAVARQQLGNRAGLKIVRPVS